LNENGLSQFAIFVELPRPILATRFELDDRLDHSDRWIRPPTRFEDGDLIGHDLERAEEILMIELQLSVDEVRFEELISLPPVAPERDDPLRPASALQRGHMSTPVTVDDQTVWIAVKVLPLPNSRMSREAIR